MNNQTTGDAPDHDSDSNSADHSFTIIIPVCNEEGYISGALERIQRELDGVLNQYRMIIVENGSSDATFEEIADRAASPLFEIVRLPDPDYGLAVRTGMQEAGHEGWLVLFNIDYYSSAFISEVQGLADENDVVIASKTAPGSQDRRPWPRRVITWGLNFLLRVLIGTALTDTHGIKAIRASTAQQLIPTVRLDKDLFDTELLLRAERVGCRITETPIAIDEQRPSRSGILYRIVRSSWGLVKLRYYLGGKPNRSQRD